MSQFKWASLSAVLFAVILFSASATFAQTDTWNNPPPAGFWSNGANWSGGVPTSTSNVQIGAGAQTIAPTVTLDINSTVASLNLDGAGTTLVLTGDSVIHPAAAVNLTVTGATNVGIGSAIDIGGGASLTLNGNSSNQGTINLSTTTIVVGEAPDIGQLNGSGTLANSGTISGTGTVSINVTNTPAGVLTGNLALNGITVTGGGYVQGQLLSINSTFNGVTLGGTSSSFPPTPNQVTLVGGSVITVQNEIINVGNLDLANTGGGVTIKGTGLINNQGFIFGSGTISTDIDNARGFIQTASSAAPLVLQGNVSGDGTHSFITVAPNSTLVLDGAQVTENTLQGNGGTLTAQNGASFKDGTIGGATSSLTLSAGSILDVSSSKLNGSLILNNATINGKGQLDNNGAIQGNGTVALNVQNTSTGTLSGNLTVSGVTVTGGSYTQGNLTATNATFQSVEYGGTSGTVTLTGGSILANGAGSVGGTLVLGSGGVGATITQVPSGGFLVNNGFIEGGGTISADIDNGGIHTAGMIVANNTTVPLVLQGFIDTEAESANAAIISIGAHSSLVLDGATISGNTLQGNGGNLSATNGASFIGNGVIDGTNDRVLLTGGSVLRVSGATVKGTFQLGDGSGGATLNGAGVGLELADGSILHGGGTINTQIQGTGDLGAGSIIADSTAAPLVLAGNVSGVKSVSAASGGTLTLAGSTVTTAAASVGAGSTLNGSGTIRLANPANTFTNSGTIAPGGAGGPALLIINGFYTQASGAAMDFTLGGGQNAVEIENTFAESIANFQAGSVIDASFLSGFDPSSGCATTFGVCETFDVFDTEDILGATATFSGFGNLTFNLPTLPAGFQWLTIDNNNDQIELEIEGMKSSSGGGGGNGTTMPEPSEWMMTAAGLLALLGSKSFARRRPRHSARA